MKNTPKMINPSERTKGKNEMMETPKMFLFLTIKYIDNMSMAADNGSVNPESVTET